MKHAKYRLCISSICEQSLGKKRMKTFGVTDYTHLTTLKCCRQTDRWEKCLGSTPIKNEKKQ